MNALDRTHSLSRSLRVLAALACAVSAPSAIAASVHDEPEAMTVSYADLDLSNEEGAEALYRRIRSAARTVCDVSVSRDLREIRLARDCYDAAVTEAVATLDTPLVTALHRNRVASRGTG